MDSGWTLWALIGFPAAAAVGCLLARPARLAMLIASTAGAGWGVLAVVAGASALCGEPFSAGAGWLRLDALSGLHTSLLGMVFGASSVFAWGYFRPEVASGRLADATAGRF